MIFNNADNMMFGNKEVDKVYYHDEVVWEKEFGWISDASQQTILKHLNKPRDRNYFLNWSETPINVSEPFNTAILKASSNHNVLGDYLTSEYKTDLDDTAQKHMYLNLKCNCHDSFKRINLTINYNDAIDKTVCDAVETSALAYVELNSLNFINCTLNSVGDYAFYNFFCLNDMFLNFSNDFVFIGENAFCNSEGIKSVELLASNITIGRSAFRMSDCETITFPNSVEELNISAFAFYGTHFTDINLPYGIKKIERYVFSNSELSNINLPDTITEIQEHAFSNCNFLYNIKLPNIKTISYGTFLSCNNLQSIVIPDTVEVIQDYAFSGCLNLSNIKIPNEVTSIGYHAFNGTPFLNKQIDEIKYIGEWIVQCDNVDIVNIKSGTTGIAACSFYECYNIQRVVIPDSVVNVGGGVFGSCKNLSDITFSLNMNKLSSYDIYQSYKYRMWTLGFFEGCSKLETIQIPDNITYIGERCFANCTSLKNIEIANKNTYIDCGAFYGCTSLTNIDLPNMSGILDCWQRQGRDAEWRYAGFFEGCTNLTEVSIPPLIEEIGERAFYNCTALKDVFLNSTLKKIRSYAFYNCIHLLDITIPDSVTRIATNAFPTNCVIHGYSGSYAETWAKNNGYTFEVITNET